MSRIGISSLRLFCLCPLLSLTVGCAGLRLPDPPTEDIAETRQLRADEATRYFDSSRDFAQLQDAAARWTQGDAKGCEEELQRMLARNPQHRNARLFLADVCRADERQQEALEHVLTVLDTHPQDAHANHTMGLLCDMAGNPAEAAAYYRKAAEAEPDNELYALSYQTACSADSDSVGFTDTSDQNGNDGSPGRVVAMSHENSTHEKRPKETLPAATTARIRETEPTNPNDPQIPLSAATAALRNNQPAQALELLTAAQKEFPNSAAVHRIVGVAHYRLGNYESSQVALQQALSLDNSAAVSYFLMGCTQVKLGQSESADANFRQARAIDPTYSARR